jgi:N-acetylmuramoyl-L-alanine amidase
MMKFNLHRISLKSVFLAFLALLFTVTSSVQPVAAFEESFYGSNGILYYDDRDVLCNTSAGSNSNVSLSGKDSLEKIYNFLLGKISSVVPVQERAKILAAGALGNIVVESAGTGDPTIVQGGGHSTDPSSVSAGYGIIQWTPGRKIIGLLKEANISGDPASLETQLQLVWWHMTVTSPTGQKNFMEGYKSQSTVESATRDYMNRMEAPGIPHFDQRVKAAELAMKWGDGATTGGNEDGTVTPADSSANGCACPTGNPSSGGAGTVLLDPGHSKTSSVPTYDPGTGLQVGDSYNPGETEQMFDVASKVKKQLESKGYKVLMTKSSASDSINLKERADMATKNNVALAVSIHNTPGAFGSSATAWVTPQEVGKYRTTKDDKKITFTDAATAKKSQEYAQKIIEARKKNESGVVNHELDFTGRGGGIAPGNISIVQLLTKVPWVYNETGQTGFDADKYAAGIASGIESAVKPSDQGSGSGSDSGSGADNADESGNDTPEEAAGAGAAIGNIPAGGEDVGATLYGGNYVNGKWEPSNGQQGGGNDDNGMGNDGVPLPGKTAYAELGNGTAMGKLPNGTKLQISYKGKSIVAEKRDIGGGGGPIEGKPRKIDLWWETARLLDMRDSAVVNIKPVSQDTPLTPVDGSAAASSEETTCSSSVSGGSIVQVAEAEFAKNVHEYDSNVLKYTTGRQEAWCADFVSWVYKEAGTPFTDGGAGGWQHPSVLELQGWFKKKHIYFDVGSQQPQPGDVAFYIGSQTPDGGSTQHVNLVISVNGDKMVTIGGNESNSVKRSTRSIKVGSNSLVGFGRLK